MSTIFNNSTHQSISGFRKGNVAASYPSLEKPVMRHGHRGSPFGLWRTTSSAWGLNIRFSLPSLHMLTIFWENWRNFQYLAGLAHLRACPSSPLSVAEWMIKYLDTHNAEYIYWATSEFTELPQNLLSYLRIYWVTSDFTELPQNLLSYLRFYWATSDFTELPQNFTELPGFSGVRVCVLPDPVEVY